MNRQPVIHIYQPLFSFQRVLEGLMTLAIIWAALRSPHAEPSRVSTSK